MAGGVDVVRQYFDPYDGIDFKAPVMRAIESRGDGDAAEAMAQMGSAWAVVAPEIEWDTSPIAGGGPETTFSGYAGFLRFWKEWLSVWEEYAYTVVDYLDRGETVIADLEVQAVGIGGIPANWRAAQVCEVRDGKIVRMRVFPTTEAAVASLETA